LHKIPPEPNRRYNTRGVNLYNKFSSTLDSGESSSANATINAKRKSQYSHIFENHQIEDESSESDSDEANDSDSQPQEDDILTDDENSSIDSDEDDDGKMQLYQICFSYIYLYIFKFDINFWISINVCYI
jgi:hypothetical protein